MNSEETTQEEIRLKSADTARAQDLPTTLGPKRFTAPKDSLVGALKNRASNALVILAVSLLCAGVCVSLNWDYFELSTITFADRMNWLDEDVLRIKAELAWNRKNYALSLRLFELLLSKQSRQGYSIKRGYTLDDMSKLALYLHNSRGELQYSSEAVKNQLIVRGQRDPILAQLYYWLSTLYAKLDDNKKARHYAEQAARTTFIAADPESSFSKKFWKWYLLKNFRNQSIANPYSPFMCLDIAGQKLMVKPGEPGTHLFDGFNSEIGKKNLNPEHEYKAAVESSLKIFGPDSPFTATYMNNLACFLRSRGRVAEAVEWERKCDAIRAKQPKPPGLDESIPLDDVPPK